ncbi:hypothetical protein A1O1_05951 [Capronia coronata CBS 617.96]|uniref:Carrier domain-containing protein n=1 Tax=Capronia coronata CBS 617.96 TaxID=1182541 RepID=W9Y8L8_9EURO|nr:uncharacterized protein A1O1_05951 [Capronia coronata CBS 617.96]EXJ85586.1 hypothetical protein A1O1_05951 [Capronia coronata CBS 617.96]
MSALLTSEAAKDGVEFWDRWQVEAEPCVFPTLVDTTRAAAGTARLSLPIEPGLLPRLHNVSDQHISSSELVLAVAWALVLKIYTGNAAVSFGLTHEDSQNGAATLCSASLDSADTIPAISEAVKQNLEQTRPFRAAKLTDIPALKATDGRPLCTTAISLGTMPITELESPFDLLMDIQLSKASLTASLIYSTSCIEQSQARDIAASFQQALSQIITKPTHKLSDLDLVHPESLAKLFSWNSEMPSPVDTCVGQLFEQQAKTRPGNMAVHSSDESFTYEDLDRLTHALAHELQSKGVGPEVVVLLCFPKSAWAVVAMIAVIRAGGTILFFDASHPMARLQEIQSQVKSKIMLTAPEYSEMWEWTEAEVVIVDKTTTESLPRPNQPLRSSVTPSNMLYIIFTSGSTGKPKGCVIEHRQFLTGALAQQRESGMLHTDRILQLASFTFDVSILEVITSLITGACVCIPGDASRAKGPASCIQEFGVTWAFLTPSLVKLMTPEMVPNLRFLVLGGEPLGRIDVETWSPHLQLANGYGPTECSIAATGNPRLHLQTDPANIGYPLGALCWIVDPEDHRRLIPPGAPGELLVHGPIVARGYFEDPAKTEAVFIDDLPWLPKQGFGASRRMYKTGDLARYNHDGTINFISRKDTQVKLRGLRIELGEIEHHIAVHHLVRQAVVTLPRQGPCKNQLTVVMSLKSTHDDESGQLELVNAADSSITNSIASINQDASQHLPAYMVPTVWIPVKSIPLTVSGKLNRVSVTKWAVDMDETTYNTITGAEESPQPSNPTEEQILQLCSDVLELPIGRVYLNRSFVNNGGDSILGMKLLARLRQAGIHVSVKDMIESKTLVELASRTSAEANPVVQSFPVVYDMAKFRVHLLPHLNLPEDEIEDAYPLGPIQRGIMLSQGRDVANYELRIVCEIVGALGGVDIGRLKQAWESVLQRHSSLRTVFVRSISEVSSHDQVVLKSAIPLISVVRCQDLAEVSKLARSHHIVAASNQPRVNLVIYQTPDKTYCMTAVDHALIDGLSVLLMFRDLSAAYSGRLDPREEMKFSEYIGYLQQLDKTDSLQYWKDYLQDVVPCQFPILNDDKPEPHELHEVSAQFHAGTELQEFCRKHNFTASSVIQTAWAIVLKCYTGLDDVSFGYLSAGRDAPVIDIEDAVGAYINMLICRLKLPTSSKVIQLVESVQDSFLKGMPHQHCSLAEIQHEVQIREPLFSTIMSLQSAVGEVIQAAEGEGNIAFRIVDEVDCTEYDISVNVAISRESININLRHYTSTISDAMAKNVFHTFQHVITTILQQPNSVFGEMPVLSQHDQEQLQSWNVHDWEDIPDCIHEQVAHQVSQNPEAIAIDAWDGKLTYRELDNFSSALAAHLSVLGVGPEVLVPLSFKKSVWTPVAQLGVLKAGGACVAFDPAHPQRRREELIRQCGARLAVTAPAHRSLFEGLVDNVVVVEQSLLDTPSRANQIEANSRTASPNNAAFVVFTSGSTGKPKGIVLEHHALVTSAHAHGPAMKYGPGSRVLQFASYTFDVSIGETFTCLMLGGTLCIPNEEERMDDLAGVINRMDVRVAYLTPSVASILHPDDVPGLKVLALGGEAVRAENIALWADRLYLVNIYGPAECSVWSTGLQPVPKGTSPANIGFGLGAWMWITEIGNPDKLCSIGCIGELLIEGPIVARGYLKDQEKTNAAFISDPAWMPSLAGGGSHRLYRTGDLARYNSDGSVNFIGRRDFQIKLHGQRIEMGEIEHNILSYNDIANAVVLYSGEGPVKEKLVAVVSLKELPTASDTDDIRFVDLSRSHTAVDQVSGARTHLSERVPGYMMPSIWLVVEAIPLSVNGKTDRSRVSRWIGSLESIPGQEIMSSAPSKEISLPTTQAEDSICAVISVVLGVPGDAISMEQSFVGLGGDSITAMQVSARSRENGMAITVKDILLSKTIRQIASNAKVVSRSDALTDRSGDTGAFTMLSETDVALLDREAQQIGLAGLDDILDGYPCSPMQQGILISQAQSSNNYKFYVICEARPSSSNAVITPQRLATAWERVVNRHPILRTVFVESGSGGGVFHQFVLKNASPRIDFVDSFEALTKYPYTNPVDYEEKTPPHRLTVCEMPGKVVFNLEISHTLIDGASMAVIMKDLAAGYEQPLPAGPPYRDYISILQEQSKEQSLSHWKTYLSGAEPSAFPALNDELVGTKTLEAVKVAISESTTKALLEYSRNHGVTLANVFQLVWALVIRAFSSSNDVLFGFLASGRDVAVPNVEDGVGPYINMLVCRVDTGNHVVIAEALKKFQHDYLDSLPHQHTSLGEIQHALGFNSTGMFNTILSLQRPMAEGIKSDSEISIDYLQGNDPTEYDLSVNITSSDRAIEASISYWSTFLSGEQADRVAATFSEVLGQILDQKRTSISEVDLLSPQDRELHLLWNNNAVAPAKVEEMIHEDVAKHASDRPDAPAIAAWDGNMTFRELDEISTILAHHLRHLGVGPEVKVPLCFDKSRFAIISMLAILKAGGAYASMDPAHPIQHLSNIVRETDAKFALAGSAIYADKLKGIVDNVVLVDAALFKELRPTTSRLTATSTCDNAAFICFTSGSTGKPKAICLTHSSFTSMVTYNKDMGIGPQSRVFQFAAYTFDTSNSEIFTTLTSGGCVCIPSESERLDDPAGAMNRLGVNWTFLTPSMASLLTPGDVPCLRTLALGGEQVRDDIVNVWKDDVRVINSFGPAECTIWTSMADLGHGNSPATISRGNGGNGSLLWVADLSDTQRLAPIGTVGELLIEGPILARGYLDSEKTMQAFITAPSWRGSGYESIRMYKSGDLVRYHHDGTVIYVGRKDGQVKLNGQRIEMGEVEAHIAGNDLVRYAVVLVPKKGICKRKLIAVVAPSKFTKVTMASQEPRTIADRTTRERASAQLSEVKDQLRGQLPGYMVPSVWLIVEAFPLTASKKVDRVRVSRWVEELTYETYTNALDIEEEQFDVTDAAGPEAQIQKIISSVLNIPVSQVNLSKSFINLGGDSILAMQLVVQCRKEGLKVSVKNVIRSKTISALALSAESSVPENLSRDETFGVPFELSPIQTMYFSEITHGSTKAELNQFNQSFLLNVTRQLNDDKFSKAIDQIVQNHSMLRARFQKDSNGHWSQVVPPHSADSYRVRVRSASNREEALLLAEQSQGGLDIENGPVFAAELFNISPKSQLLFLVAHHLVVDLVSWRVIIRQLEECLTTGISPSTQKPFPFNSWLKKQAEYARANLEPEAALPYAVPAADYDFWSMSGSSNLRGETEEISFDIGPGDTELLLRGCHQAMRTDALDVFLAAAFQSFSSVFGRPSPAIFCEGHGRESWHSQIDITETVGWFTTMFPLFVTSDKSPAIINTVRQVKDQRQQLPRNGWSYFNSRFSNKRGKVAFAGHTPIEILFNYLGVYQSRDQSTGLLQPEPFNKGDVGPHVRRFALIEINVYVLDGQAHFSIIFNRNVKHQDKIKAWADSYQPTVIEMANALKNSERRLTLGDVPLLATNYQSLRKFELEQLPQMQIDVDGIEDVYACSPMQMGILLSQNRLQGAYQIQTIVEVLSDSKSQIDVGKLGAAWRLVVERHQALRTVFIQRISDQPYDQLVLKMHAPDISIVDAPTEEAVVYLNSLQNLDYAAFAPPHRLTVLTGGNGRVFAKLEISHALVDGTSMSILISEWVRAYQGQLANTPGPLYSDYIAYISSQRRDEALKYWSSNLSDVRPCHFPVLTDNEATPARYLHNMPVRSPNAARIRDFCQQNNITLASIFRLAWGIVLRTYTGDDQVCFGYLTSGREVPVAGIEDAVGAFINMLVCSLDFNRIGKRKIADILEDLQDEYSKSLPFQHTSLAEIQHELGLAGETLFNTVLSFQRRTHGDFKEGDVSLRYLDGVDPTEYDISISVADSEEGVHVHMSYFTSRLSDGQASNVANALFTTLTSILETPQSKVTPLDLFGDHDAEQILTWNRHNPAPVDRCVHQIFQDNVCRSPDALAVESWDGTFTYGELDRKSTQLAHELLATGVEVNELVPILFEKSAWAIVAMLAIMKAGAGYVPLDPAHPDDRLQAIVAQTGSQLALASEVSTGRATRLVDQVLTVGAASQTWSSKATDAPNTSVTVTDVAYTLFTSGSTGLPKGVVLPHLAVSSSIVHHGAEIGCSPATRMYQFAAYTFDACILEIFTTLAYGGCICVPSDAERMSDIAGFINRLRVNTSFMTPSLIRILTPEQIPTMKTLILGGEALGKDNIETWANNLRLMNGYGPTETCVFAVMKTFKSPKDRNDILGKAVGAQAWIVQLDNPSRLAPVGAVGLLFLSGATVARGYLNDQAKTDSVFIESPPFLPMVDGVKERAYNTGDLARYNADGTITYLGRRDTQVKLRGQRIELAEIEHHIKASFADASQVAVEVVEPQGQKERATLAAFVSLPNHPQNSATFFHPSEALKNKIAELRKSLTSLLPPYEIPSLYIPISTMPTTTAGKLDRKALRDIVSRLSDDDLNIFSLSDALKRPLTTESELELASLWQEVLKIPISQIGSDDNFFRLGGDSIMAMRLAAKSTARMSLSVSDIFQNPVLSDMAATAGTNVTPFSLEHLSPFALLQPVTSVKDVVAELASMCQVMKDQVEDCYPCTPLQEGLMVLSIVNPGAYVAQKVFKLHASMDMAKFKTAWELTIANHAILRTAIVQTASGHAQQVLLRGAFTWRSADSLEEYLQRDQDEEMAYGRPLSRYAITNDGYFIWTAHHAMYDGWSVPLILEQVRSYYAESTAPTTPGFNRFIRYLSDTSPDTAHEFWKQYLSGEKPPTFPEQPSASHRIKVDQEAHHSMAIRRKAGSEVSMAALLRAAWAYCISQYADSKDVVFGVTLSGRNCPVPDIAQIIGPTITTVPVRVTLDDGVPVLSFLKNVQDQATEMIPYEHFGLQNIARVSTEAANAIQFQNIFVVQPRSQFDVHHNELLGAEEVATPLKNFDTYPLIMECSLDDKEVHLEARFDKSILSNDRVEGILCHFEHVVRQLNDASETMKLRDITMFSEGDMTQILTWNKEYPETLKTTVPEVFAEQVKARPEALAIDAWDGQLTYAELDRLSTTFALQLIDNGVGPEVLVPLCFEKSRWAVVSQMAVMKAGGGCVNLDPAHPLSRLELIIQDARATIMLVAPQFREKFSDIEGLKIVSIDEGFYKILENSPAKAEQLPGIKPRDTAYVLFTSGSTGRPKGIVIEHGSLCSSSKAHGTEWDIGPDTRLLQFAAYTFDVSCADIFTTLQRGGCICVPSEHDRINDLAGAINRFQCNWAFLTPTVASLLPAQAIPSLRKLVLGGEASTRDTIAKWHSVLDLIVCYGPAECSVYCSGAPPATATSDPADLGKAIGALYWIADPLDYNRLVPIGCVGELLLEGPILARGYLGDKEKTAHAFVSNPVWARAEDGAAPRRFYRTGDLVRYNGDGTIHFVGRKDTQVKIRGQRVELGEIEHAIRVNLPGLAHVTVDAVRQENQGGRQAVVAFLHRTTVSGPAKVADMDDTQREELIRLQRSLSESLPSYMVPTLFIPMAQVPLTMNGKADRRALRDLAASLSREQSLKYGLEDATKEEPTTATEFMLRDLWAQILSVGPATIGRGDHFFRLGGDSIVAMKLVGAAAEKGLPLSVKDVFRSPVLSALAAELDGRTHFMANGAATYEPFSLLSQTHPRKLVEEMAVQLKTPKANIVDVLPATDFQKTAVAHAMMKTRGFRNYLWLDGVSDRPLDVEVAKEALTKFVEAHEILRTVFALHENNIVQVVLQQLAVTFDVEETNKDIADFTERLCKADAALPTKLTDPLLKFFVVTQVGSNHHRIIMRISHAQYDGVCLPRIWQSLREAFESTMSHTPLQPYSAYLRGLCSMDKDEAHGYWETLLKGANMTNVVSHSKPSYSNVYNTVTKRAISTPSLSSHGITFATILKASWSIVLSSLSRSSDIVFGHVVSGRNLDVPDIEKVVGCCISIVPVRATLDKSMTNLQLLEALQDQHAASLPYEAVGSRTIVRECTAWPKYTRMSSIVQHQNIEEESTVDVNGTRYKVDFFCPEADEADLAIKTTPLKDGTTEVLLICSDRAIKQDLRNFLIDSLCDTIESMCEDPTGTVNDTTVHASSASISIPIAIHSTHLGTNGVTSHANGNGLIGSVASRIHGWEPIGSNKSIRDELVKAWRAVLGLPKDKVAKLGDDDDFFGLGGDLVAAAVLAARLDMDGVGMITVEEIIDASTLAEMVNVLERRS